MLCHYFIIIIQKETPTIIIVISNWLQTDSDFRNVENWKCLFKNQDIINAIRISLPQKRKTMSFIQQIESNFILSFQIEWKQFMLLENVSTHKNIDMKYFKSETYQI